MRSLAVTTSLVVGLLAFAYVLGEGKAGEPQSAAVTAHILLAPSDIKWVDAPPSLPAGAKFAVVEGDPKVSGKLVTFQLKLPAKYKVPPHWHPADEHVTVIAGEFKMGMGDSFDETKMKALPPGSFAVMPAKHQHFAMAGKKGTIVQVHAIGPWGINYVNPADDPRLPKKTAEHLKTHVKFPISRADLLGVCASTDEFTQEEKTWIANKLADRTYTDPADVIKTLGI